MDSVGLSVILEQLAQLNTQVNRMDERLRKLESKVLSLEADVSDPEWKAGR
jgi:ubiquinone biosynthesis protein UbiJ